MFDKFGEFDSSEEINRAVEAQFNEGDYDAIRAIAKENGIDAEDAEDYISGMVEEMVNPYMAASGKIKIESENLKIDKDSFFTDWTDLLKLLCLNDQNLAMAVRRKGKSLKECFAAVLKKAFDIKKQVPDEITKAAGLKTPLYVGMPSRKDIADIMKKYYMGGQK